MDMALEKNTLQEECKSLSHLKTQFDYCLVRRKQRKFSKDMKVLPSESPSISHCYAILRQEK